MVLLLVGGGYDQIESFYITNVYRGYLICPLKFAPDRALEVITRIQAKLTGRDFAKSDGDMDLTVEQQVDRLIREATSAENLCQLYIGWCPMW